MEWTSTAQAHGETIRDCHEDLLEYVFRYADLRVKLDGDSVLEMLGWPHEVLQRWQLAAPHPATGAS